ncbi:putative membrane protein [Bacteroides ovatus str. 3725 D9 iii]|nr:putative membrane protein [Bacteroides ovatus str. 3725 D9 iii]
MLVTSLMRNKCKNIINSVLPKLLIDFLMPYGLILVTN